MPSTPVWRPNTQRKYTATANIGNDIAFLNVSIHGPGRGRRLSRLGNIDRTTYGMAMPRPSAVKTATASGADAVMAKPTAPAMKGAAHGVAMSVARMPLTNEPTYVLRAVPSAAPAAIALTLPPISNVPARLRPITNRSSAIAATTIGDWSWKPQPTASPAARSASRIAISAQNDMRTPTPNA